MGHSHSANPQSSSVGLKSMFTYLFLPHIIVIKRHSQQTKSKNPFCEMNYLLSDVKLSNSCSRYSELSTTEIDVLGQEFDVGNYSVKKW